MDVRKFVDSYYMKKISEGQSLYDIIDSFKSIPLPEELRESKFPEDDIRREGQNLANSYLSKRI